MTANDRQRVVLLVLLLGVLALTLWGSGRLYRPNPAPAGPLAGSNPGAAGASAPGLAVEIPENWLERPDLDNGAPGRNPFAYGPAPVQPRPAPPPPPPVVETPLPPPPPPPPPPIPFRYSGYATHPVSGALTAFLFDGQGQYPAAEGDTVLGRFRVLRVSQDWVQIQDLQFNRTETINREGR